MYLPNGNGIKKRSNSSAATEIYGFEIALSFVMLTRSSAYCVYKRVCRKIAVHLLVCVFKQSLAMNGYFILMRHMDILLYQEQFPSVF